MQVELATRADEAALRRLLRRGVMGERPRLSLEREPDYFRAAATEGDRHQTIIARHGGSGEPLAMGSRAVRRRFVDGRSCRVPYLGALRAASDLPRNLSLMKQCYDLCRTLQQADETCYAITSIMADNLRARRLLERGLPGMPRYRRLGRQHTVVMPVARRPRLPHGLRRGAAADLADIADLLQRHGRRFLFHPVWDEAEIDRLRAAADLAVDDFLIVRRDDRLVGCAAVWDQRTLRQTVIRGWGRGLSLARPLFNVASPLLGTAPLPAVGSALASGFLSHLAVAGDDPKIVAVLLAGAHWLARRKGLDWLVAGFGEGHPLLPMLGARRRSQHLENIVYLVHWPGDEAHLPSRDSDAPLALEVATL